jgi:hypothetical protein
VVYLMYYCNIIRKGLWEFNEGRRQSRKDGTRYVKNTKQEMCPLVLGSLNY